VARFHTLYTSIAVRGPDEYGEPLPPGDLQRIGRPFHSRWLGRIGEMQVLPTGRRWHCLASLWFHYDRDYWPPYVGLDGLGPNPLSQDAALPVA